MTEWRTYVYDAENRMIKAVNGSTQITNTYDPVGRLVQELSGPITHRFYYAGSQMLEWHLQSGTGPDTSSRSTCMGPGWDYLCE